jgi:predicted Zn-dependent protease
MSTRMRWLIVLLTVGSVSLWGTVFYVIYRAVQAEQEGPLFGGQAFGPRVAEDPAQRRQEVARAFNQPGKLNEVLAREPRALFERLQAACRARDFDAASRCFDFDRMFEEAWQGPGLFPRRENDRGAMQRALRQGGERSLAASIDQFGWARVEIKSVTPGRGPDEVVVIIRHRDDAGVSNRLRWWLRRGPDGWKVFDFEDLAASLRLTAIIALGMPAAQGAPPPAWAGSVGFFKQTQDALRAGDFARAEKALQQVAQAHFPGPLESCRWLLLGVVHVETDRPAEALTDCDRAERHNPDLPALHLLRGRACNRLGRHEEALAHVRKFTALLGDDNETYYEVGLAEAGLGRTAEAVAALRKSLDDEPNSPGSLGELCKVLPQGRKAELAERFLKMPRPAEQFYHLADGAWRRGDRESVEVLATALRRRDPNEPDAAFYLARLKGAGRLDEALPLYRAALEKQGDANLRQEYLTEMLHDALDARRPLDGYRAAPDPAAAFSVLAGQLAPANRLAELRELLKAHARARPGDPLLHFYHGELFISERRYDKAEEAFAAGMDQKLDEPLRKSFLSSRTYARFAAGKALSAYADLRPRREVFNELAGLLASAHDARGLQELFAAHRRADPRDAGLPFWEAEVHWLARDYEGTLGVLVKHRDRLLADKAQQAKVRERLVRCLAHLGRRDEARKEAQALLGGGPAGKKATLAEFQNLARAAQGDGEDSAVEILAQVMCEVAPPPDAEVLFELARARGRAGKFDSAVEVYRMAINQQTDAGKRQGYLNSLLSDAVGAGRPLAGYEAAPDRPAAFKELGHRLLADGDHEALKQLIDTHARAVPDDPLVPYFRGELAVEKGAYDRAEKAFSAAKNLKKLDVQTLRTFQSRRVYARFKAGKGLSAYAELGSPRETFAQLASLYAGARDLKQLETLLAAHRQKDPKDSRLPLWEAEARWLARDHAGAVQVLTAHRREILADRSQRYRFCDRLLEGLGRLQRFAEAGKEAERLARGPDGELYDVLGVLDRAVRRKDVDLAAALAGGVSTALPDRSQGIYQRARVELLRGRVDEAVGLYKQALAREPNDQIRRGYTNGFLLDMAPAGKALEGYRAAPDAAAAFRTLGGDLARLHRKDELRRLVEAHRQREPNDRWLRYYEGELLLEEGRYAEAEKVFAAGPGPSDRGAQTSFDNRRQYALVKAGKATSAYAEQGPGKKAFDQLAWVCEGAKDGKQLEELVKAHRRHDPADRSLPAWEAEARWLLGDYEGTVAILRKQGRRALALPAHTWRLRDRLVRSLVRLKRFDEALKEAQARGPGGRNMVLEVLVRAAAGDMAKTAEALQAGGDRPYLVASCYRDPDLGPLLRGDRFRAVRERYPEPKEGDEPLGPEDLDD